MLMCLDIFKSERAADLWRTNFRLEVAQRKLWTAFTGLNQLAH